MIFIGCDRAGTVLKEAIMSYLDENSIKFEDLSLSPEDTRNDYVMVGKAVATKVSENSKDHIGILCCGTGLGMSMVANKISGIRAAVCDNEYSVAMSRKHNDANILCLGGRIIAPEFAIELVKIFLSTDFEGGRHKTRVDEISTIDGSI